MSEQTPKSMKQRDADYERQRGNLKGDQQKHNDAWSAGYACGHGIGFEQGRAQVCDTVQAKHDACKLINKHLKNIGVPVEFTVIATTGDPVVVTAPWTLAQHERECEEAARQQFLADSYSVPIPDCRFPAILHQGEAVLPKDKAEEVKRQIQHSLERRGPDRRIDAKAMGNAGGGHVSYYSVDIDVPSKGGQSYRAEAIDIISALDMTFSEGEAFKAIWRCAADRCGAHKAGNDTKRDADKVVYYGEQMVARETRREPK